MDDAGFMSTGQAGSNLRGNVQRLTKAEFRASQRFAGYGLAYEIDDAVHFADVVSRHNIWVVEGGHGTRFHLETLAARRVGGHFRRKHFQRDVTVQARVADAIDFTHSTRPK